MADNKPRRPHPNQQYEHPYKPLTAAAVIAKNHGRKPAPGTKAAKRLEEVMAKEAAAKRLKATAAAAAAVHQRMQQQDADRKAGKTPDMTVPKGAPTKSAAAKAGQPRGAESQKAEDALRAALARKTAAPKPEKQAETPAPAKVPEKPAAKKPVKAAKAAASPKADATAKALDYAKKLKGDAKTASPQKEPPAKPAAQSSGKVSDTEAQDRIIDAVRDSMVKGSWGTMAAVREKLGGMDRKQQDRLIADMMLEGKLDLVPASNPGSLTQDERDAAINIGSAPNHRVRLGDKKHTRQSPSTSLSPEPDASTDKPTQGESSRKVSNAQVESEVLDALKNIPGPNGSRWNTMGQLRDALKGIPRKQQDDVIRQMMLDGKVDIEPVAIYNNLPQKERDAEIMIGPTPNHQIRLSR